MILYDQLFFHAYCLAKKSKANRDMPLFVPLMVVSVCFIFNLTAVFFLLDAFGVMESPNTEGIEWLFAFIVLGLFAFYFLWNKRYKKIVARRAFPKRWHSVIIIVAFYVLSFVLALLAGMYMNQDGIFK
jgi:drug/metabolite transporter (DMT)-like permease